MVKATQAYFLKEKSGVALPNGVFLQVYTPASKDIKSYSSFPSSISNTAINGYKFYPEDELPDDLKGVYFEILNKGSLQESILHAE